MIAGIGMGKEVVPPPDTFDLGIVTVAVIIHMALSLVCVVILALIISRMAMGMAIVVGAVFGLAVYLINFYGFTALFPWFANARGGLSIFTHVAFGVVAAWAYKGLQKPRTTL